MLNPASARPKAALRPAPPAPTTRAILVSIWHIVTGPICLPSYSWSMTGYLNMSTPLLATEQLHVLVADETLSLLSTQWIRPVCYYPRCGSRRREQSSLWCELHLVSVKGSRLVDAIRTLHEGLKLRNRREELILKARCKKTRIGCEERRVVKWWPRYNS